MIVVDRFEDDEAVLEIGGRLVSVPRAALPDGTVEGSVLQLSLAPADTDAVLRASEARLARLRAATPQGPGDFEL